MNRHVLILGARLFALALAVSWCAGASAQNFKRKPDVPDTEAREPEVKITVEVAAPVVAVAPSKYSVRILRDVWGVPHIFGKSDADAAYGLGYAHCEDDFKTIQDLVVLGRARGAEIHGAEAAPIDFMVHLLGVWDDVNAKYETDLDAPTRALCEAYADAINDYAAAHADQIALPDLYPVTGKDIVAGFAFRSPFFFGLDGAVLELFGDERKHEVSQKRASLDFSEAQAIARAGAEFRRGAHLGSNTFAVGPHRSTDGSTFLNINSHQPWEGPVAWWEVHVHSEEGWDMAGGTFPGSPMILHGHNRNLGWAHTVNSPDLVDIYVLTINPENENQYWFDGEWRDFEVKQVKLKVRVNPDSPMTMPVNREVLRSVHGPVLKQPHGTYAIRYAGMGAIGQAEQWYRMNKARNLDEWLAAMKMRTVSSLNCGYADRDGNILYLYNASLPVRAEGYDWESYLPGDTSETLWTEIIPFEKLPMLLNPPSGFIQNCNSSPFTATDGEGNVNSFDYPKSMGIEAHETNRSMRTLELFSSDQQVDFNEFYAYKFDTRYSKGSRMAQAVRMMLDGAAPDDALINEALAVVRAWDLDTNIGNPNAALPILTVTAVIKNSSGPMPAVEDLYASLKKTAEAFKSVHGVLDPAWGEVNRIRRGDVDLGTSGGPDTLHAVYGKLQGDGAHLVGSAGDSYIMLVAWDKDGKVFSRSLHQYGAATSVEDSAHYNDQVAQFVEKRMKPVWMNEADIQANLEIEYRPGEGPAASAP